MLRWLMKKQNFISLKGAFAYIEETGEKRGVTLKDGKEKQTPNLKQCWSDCFKPCTDQALGFTSLSSHICK